MNNTVVCNGLFNAYKMGGNKMNKCNFAQLAILDDGFISTVLMNQPQVVIGRYKGGSKCDVYLTSSLVSAKHGAFSFYNGEYYYTDLVNVNGTYINGNKIEKKPGQISAAYKLRDGDIITIGVSGVSREKTVNMVFSTGVANNYAWNTFSLMENYKREITIGRGQDCDIVIPDINVSRVHAVISIKEKNLIFISDKKSLNGTIVNNMLLRTSQPFQLGERDSITIGAARLFILGMAIVYCVPKPISEPVFRPEPQEYIEKSIHIESRKVNEVPVNFEEINNRFGRGYARQGGVELRAEKLTRIVPCKKGTGINGTDKKYILQDVSLTIYPGELVAILGGSGAGKTTFMNAVNGFEPATSGHVFFNGNDLYKNYQSYKSQIGYVPQQDIVYDNLTMKDMLTFVAQLRLPSDITKSEIEKRVNEVLKSMALEKQRDTLIKKLSGGQKKRASIAVELISDPSLFFLDEPTSGLDPEAETNLMKLLRKLSTERGKTVIVITHTLQNIHLFDKVVFLAPGGKLCYYGSPKQALDFFEVDNLSDAYEKISTDIDKYVNKYNSSRY